MKKIYSRLPFILLAIVIALNMVAFLIMNMAGQFTKMVSSRKNVIPQARTIKVIEATSLSDEDIDLIALITMAEAEGECEEGKRLVIDTILNRMDSEYFPDTVREVIYQPNQFESVWNGRVDRCHVDDNIRQLVKEELHIRSNSEVIFFTAGEYSSYGTPIMQVENHYFSKY